jgi:sulfur-carrier protein adenylyltransferase/sulfurtransferase
MEGGIRAWNGMVATGGLEAGMAYFEPAAGLREMVALAWAMEEGSRRFYQGAGERLQSDPEAAELFRQLIRAEEGHKRSLLASYDHLAGRPADPASLAADMEEAGGGGTMEGGISVREALSWLEGRELAELLELAMGLEINAYDLYIKMGRRVGDEERQIFAGLAREEQQHLERLAQLLDRRL